MGTIAIESLNITEEYLQKSDNELLKLFKKGDSNAFGIIYDRHWQLLYISAFKILRNDQDARIVVQNVFTSLLAERDKLLIKDSLYEHLYDLVRFRVLETISQGKIHQDLLASLNDYISSVDHYSESELTGGNAGGFKFSY